MDFCNINKNKIVNEKDKENIKDVIDNKVLPVVEPIKQDLLYRADITFLISVVSIVTILILVYYLFPLLKSASPYLFTEEQYLSALNKPESSYSLEELAKIRIEKDSFKRYYEYFSSSPYSLESQGVYDIARGVVLLPIVSFVLIYIVPPIVIAYICWFIYTYWIYVIEAVWGWFLMIYNYSTTLIECTLAEKWYIRMVTGWSTCSPQFSQYFEEWKTKYVDVPIYYEKLAYIKAFKEAKAKYWTKPKIDYIDTPLSIAKVDAKFAKKTFLERTWENFLDKLYIVYYNLFIVPRDRLYEILIELSQKESKYLTPNYPSVTTDGNACSCKSPFYFHLTSEHDKDHKNESSSSSNSSSSSISTPISSSSSSEDNSSINKNIPTCVKNNERYRKGKNILYAVLLITIITVLLIFRTRSALILFNIINNVITFPARFLQR